MLIRLRISGREEEADARPLLLRCPPVRLALVRRDDPRHVDEDELHGAVSLDAPHVVARRVDLGSRLTRF